jgi:aminoglycoside phosphotransferase (APT) family kinase protein
VELGEPLASGRTADVYGVDAQRVLRRYHRAKDVAREVAYMQHVAAHGIPVPRVFEAGGRDIVMERVDGPDLHAALRAGQLDAPTVAGHLTDLLNLLRRVPGLTGQHVVHLDLHAENVLLGPDGPVLIDWANAADGDPDLDAALALLIIAEVELAHPTLALRELLDLMPARLHGDPLRGLDRAVGVRLANKTLSVVELARIPSAGDLVRAAVERLR